MRQKLRGNSASTTLAASLFRKGILARTDVKKYFHGYEVYFIDADAWVQDWLRWSFTLPAHGKE
jgi:hypothetical protein